MHSQNEPSIQGNTISFENTNAGRNGRLHNTVLLPSLDNQQIEKIGGPGKEYWVDGKKLGHCYPRRCRSMARRTISQKASRSDQFLNVIQVMDAQPAQTALPVEKSFSSNGQYVAIAIADRIVAQALNLANNQSGEIAFALGDTKKSYQVLITDLSPGKWLMQSANGKQNFTVNKDAGTAYFISKGGKFLLQKQ